MNKVLTALLFSVLFTFSHKGLSQTSNKIYNVIPKEYENQFKEDQKSYEEYTNSLALSSGKAFNLWNDANKGYLKYYNVDSLYLAFNALKEKHLLNIIEFIKLNPNSYASLDNLKLWLLHSTRITPDSLLNVYSLLSKDLQATPLGHYVVESIYQKRSLLLNNEMPVFSFRTDKGQAINLSSFRGEKHVLLCFWASWCGPCKRNIPFLRKIDEEYKGKGLQVISVSIDSDTSNWLGAVDKYGLRWLQKCDLPAYVAVSLQTLYQIAYVPQYYLLNKEGKLIYQTHLSNEDDDYSILQEVLHKELE